MRNNDVTSVNHDFQSLNQALQQIMQSRSIPPLQDWQPKSCGEMDLVIKANGEWWHEGSPIQRASMVELFSKVLWQEDGEFYLKTPMEKIKIQVEDAPFQIHQVEKIEHNGLSYLQFSTPQGDKVLLDDEHPLEFHAKRNQQGDLEYRPYIHLRFGLYGVLQRAVFYHLLEYGELIEQAAQSILRLESGEQVFDIAVPNMAATT
ncbi:MULTISPECIES: DUF1285 domain-containing protein [unclassified Acinetobacter]|uniref:DUF1285 domain-containing protein n=1 Tax=unclassified Acinetobacter TaxID=196816 RepID=UPI0035B957B4